ncbi:MAG: tetratricopeptide repeat protein [Acidobacteria bacterium]|nr:tetratricopeptide repeat protein [Acidobacteriota bacterium]
MRLLAGLLFTAVLASQTRGADELLKEGLALARAKRFAEAATIFEEGRRGFPDDVRFLLELAGVNYRQNHTARAKSYLRKALRGHPRDNYANEFLGSIYLLDGNLAAALKYWNRIDRPMTGDVRFSPVPALDAVLRERILAVSGGQLLTFARFERTRANLERLRIFSDYRLELTPRADERYDLTIRTAARAAPAGQWWWRLLPFLRGLPYEQVNADFYNLRQNATNLMSLWRWDENKRRIALELSGPLGISTRYRVAADARDERWDLRRTYRPADGGLDGVVMRRLQAAAEVTFAIGDRVQWTPGLAVSRRRFRNGDGSSFFADGWLAEVRNRVVALLIEAPERRVRVEGWTMLRSGRFFTGGWSRLIAPQAGVTGRWFPQATGEKYEVSAQLRAGGVFGRVPLDELFMLGMERDSDLWLRGHTGTRDGRKGNAPLGSRYVLLNTGVDRELLRIPFVRVQAGPFFDLGRTGDPGRRFGSRGLLYDAGLRVRVATVGGLTISAVYGRDLHGGRPAFYTAVSR